MTRKHKDIGKAAREAFNCVLEEAEAAGVDPVRYHKECSDVCLAIVQLFNKIKRCDS